MREKHWPGIATAVAILWIFSNVVWLGIAGPIWRGGSTCERLTSREIPRSALALLSTKSNGRNSRQLPFKVESRCTAGYG